LRSDPGTARASWACESTQSTKERSEYRRSHADILAETVDDLAEMIREDPELARKIQSNPVETISELAAPLERDVWIYRIVVAALSLVAVLSIVGAIIVAVGTSDAQVPDAVVALGSAAVGAMAGLLAPHSGRS